MLQVEFRIRVSVEQAENGLQEVCAIDSTITPIPQPVLRILIQSLISTMALEYNIPYEDLLREFVKLAKEQNTIEYRGRKPQ